MIQLRREMGAFFQTISHQDTTAHGFRPTHLGRIRLRMGHPIATSSPLCLAVPRLQFPPQTELPGLVSEEAVFNARLLSV